MSLFAMRCHSQQKQNKKRTDKLSANRAKKISSATNRVQQKVRLKTNLNMKRQLFYESRSCGPVLCLAMSIRFLAVRNLTPTGDKTIAWNKHPPCRETNLTIRKKVKSSHPKIASAIAKRDLVGRKRPSVASRAVTVRA